MTTMNPLTPPILCRLCLYRSDILINIFAENGKHGYVAAEVIEDLLQLPVDREDGYPQQVCTKCLDKLTDFKLFKMQCYDSRVTFHKEIMGQRGYSFISISEAPRGLGDACEETVTDDYPPQKDDLDHVQIKVEKVESEDDAYDVDITDGISAEVVIKTESLDDDNESFSRSIEGAEEPESRVVQDKISGGAFEGGSIGPIRVRQLSGMRGEGVITPPLDLQRLQQMGRFQSHNGYPRLPVAQGVLGGDIILEESGDSSILCSLLTHQGQRSSYASPREDEFANRAYLERHLTAHNVAQSFSCDSDLRKENFISQSCTESIQSNLDAGPIVMKEQAVIGRHEEDVSSQSSTTQRSRGAVYARNYRERKKQRLLQQNQNIGNPECTESIQSKSTGTPSKSAVYQKNYRERKKQQLLQQNQILCNRVYAESIHATSTTQPLKRSEIQKNYRERKKLLLQNQILNNPEYTESIQPMLKKQPLKRSVIQKNYRERLKQLHQQQSQIFNNPEYSDSIQSTSAKQPSRFAVNQKNYRERKKQRLLEQEEIKDDPQCTETIQSNLEEGRRVLEVPAAIEHGDEGISSVSSAKQRTKGAMYSKNYRERKKQLLLQIQMLGNPEYANPIQSTSIKQPSRSAVNQKNYRERKKLRLLQQKEMLHNLQCAESIQPCPDKAPVVIQVAAVIDHHNEDSSSKSMAKQTPNCGVSTNNNNLS